MKRILFICLLACMAAASIARPRAQRVVLIALDGISTAGFTKAQTPNLDALLAQGALSMETRAVMPSVTLPNWTSHLTGSGPEQHGVVDNGWTLQHIKFPAQQTDAEGYYPSVFKVLKEQLPSCKTAFYYNWINLFYPYNPKYLDEVNYLEGDAYVENYEKALQFMAKHRNDPTLVFLYSVHTDHAGHKHQWMSDEYIRSIEEADVQIGALIDKMKADGLYDGAHIFFLSDHGGINYGHGGLTLDEMIVPWGLVGPGVKQGFTITEPNNTMNTAATILHLFKVKQKPLPWVGEVPMSIFK